jgi:hypothetical protein
MRISWPAASLQASVAGPRSSNVRLTGRKRRAAAPADGELATPSDRQPAEVRSNAVLPTWALCAGRHDVFAVPQCCAVMQCAGL